MDIEITSVSKKPESRFNAPAAVHVITEEEIRRSGMRSIPEVLRMVPGVQVAHIDASKWNVSVRGFEGNRFSNKLLVLIDGRSVYTPLFSGVFWNVQDVLMENIARIEIIRGPGATIWGANAVNGVINIITKSAKDTQGTFVEGGYGTEEQGFVSAQYGGKLGEDAFFRVYAKYFNRDGFVDKNGDGTNNDWDSGRAGMRVDWDFSEANTLTILGDIYGR